MSDRATFNHQLCPGDEVNSQMRVAALYVQTDGCYFGLPHVDPWDERRDARLYGGPWPVVANPPCQRWGKFWAGQPLWIKRTGERKIKGDDGGDFVAVQRTGCGCGSGKHYPPVDYAAPNAAREWNRRHPISDALQEE